MRYAAKKRILFYVLSGVALSRPVMAGGAFQGLPEMLEKEWASHQIVTPSRLPQNLSGPLGLTSSNSSDRYKAVRGFLRANGLHPLLNIVARPSGMDVRKAGMSLTGDLGLVVSEYAIRAGNYEVCKSSIRTVEAPGGASFILGVAPNIDAVYPVTDDSWVSLDEARNMALDGLRSSGHAGGTVVMTSSSRCLFPVQSQLEPVWKIILRSGHIPYVFYVGSAGVIEGDVMAFDATATVRSYDTNQVTGTLKDYAITVNGDGYMTNDYLTTADASSKPIGRLQSISNAFTKSPGDFYFAEQSTFAHVNEHRDWVEQNGYVWKGPKPLTIKNHFVFSGGNVNNAMYSPFDGTSGPNIFVGDGDGSVLQNLEFDSDVVSHEFGHHIIFGYLTTATAGSESLVLHEGLADTITFMRTGDSCLGESICPSASRTCYLAAKCLRTAESTIKYKDASYNSLADHLRGQVISGFFWDLRKSGSIPVADLNKLVIASITFLPSAADFKAFITAVLDADYSLYSAKYQSAILTAASGRGLGIDTLAISLSSIDGKQPPVATSAGSTSSSSGKKGFLGLCSIGATSASASAGSAIWILVGLLLPILAQIVRGARPVPVKVRKK